MFSRWKRSPRYRNLIKMRRCGPAAVMLSIVKIHCDFYDKPISRHLRPSRFFMPFGPIVRAVA
jgi:hypothetical protein